MIITKRCLNIFTHKHKTCTTLMLRKRLATKNEVEIKNCKQYALDDKMQAWQIHSYGGLDELRLSHRCRVPVITRPDDVLVKVHASSVNPIDVVMLGGYGSTLLNVMRLHDLEFPLSLGRDFCGTVVCAGHNAYSKIEPGQTVWGVVSVERQGCHADYVLVDKSCIAPKPERLDELHSSCVLYAGLTAWNALTTGLTSIHSGDGARGKKVLVLGGSGGVGSAAIQILKAEGVNVVSTCSTDATDLVQSLGADLVIDYRHTDAECALREAGPYDIILDCAGKGPNGATDLSCKYKSYVTLSSPLLRNVDESGLLRGMACNVASFLESNISAAGGKGALPVKWAYFRPSAEGIRYLGRLVDAGKLSPVIQQTFDFQDLPKAYEFVKKGHLRGKVVIDMRTPRPPIPDL